MIDALIEAIRLYNQPESIQSNDLTELMLSQIVWAETSGQHIEGVCDGILNTYLRLREHEDHALNMIGYAEAEKIMLQYYVRGGAQATGMKCDEDNFGEGFMWPESFTYLPNGEFPIEIAKKVGFTIGYLDGVKAIQIRDDMLKEAISA